jgi:hypothetical protein
MQIAGASFLQTLLLRIVSKPEFSLPVDPVYFSFALMAFWVSSLETALSAVPALCELPFDILTT